MYAAVPSPENWRPVEHGFPLSIERADKLSRRLRVRDDTKDTRLVQETNDLPEKMMVQSNGRIDTAVRDDALMNDTGGEVELEDRSTWDCPRAE